MVDEYNQNKSRNHIPPLRLGSQIIFDASISGGKILHILIVKCNEQSLLFYRACLFNQINLSVIKTPIIHNSSIASQNEN